MSILEPINTDIFTQLEKKLPPSKKCEVCSKLVALQDQGIFFHHQIIVSSGGDSSLPFFQCPSESGEHFVCSADCLEKAMHACTDEHMLPIARQLEERIRNGSEPHTI